MYSMLKDKLTKTNKTVEKLGFIWPIFTKMNGKIKDETRFSI